MQAMSETSALSTAKGTNNRSSMLTGFYRQSVEERHEFLRDRYQLSPAELGALAKGGLSLDLADRLIENVVGICGLPLGLAAHVQINARDYLVPMAVEEPSVVAGCSHAAKLVREVGGFTASSGASIMTGQ